MLRKSVVRFCSVGGLTCQTSLRFFHVRTEPNSTVMLSTVIYGLVGCRPEPPAEKCCSVLHKIFRWLHLAAMQTFWAFSNENIRLRTEIFCSGPGYGAHPGHFQCLALQKCALGASTCGNCRCPCRLLSTSVQHFLNIFKIFSSVPMILAVASAL